MGMALGQQRRIREGRLMPLYYRKRVNFGSGTHLNVSKTGASVSKRVGRVTFNSRGRVSVRILPGLSLRLGGRR